MNKSTSLNIAYVYGYQKALNTYHSIVGTLFDKISNINGTFNLRKVQPSDNSMVRGLIQRLIIKKGGIGLDNLYYDPELIDIYESYDRPGSTFEVLTYHNEVIGTIGLRPGSSSIKSCELQKLYVDSEFGTQGHERELIQLALSRATDMGYVQCFIEIDYQEVALEQILLDEGFEQVESRGKRRLVYKF